MTDHERERELPPAPVLPPPFPQGGYPVANPAHPGPRGPQQQSPYTPYGYQAYGQQGFPPPPANGGWGYGTWQPAPPPKRTSGLVRVALALVGVGAMLLFGLVILSAVMSPESRGGLATGVDHAPAAPDRGRPADPPDGTGDLLTANPLYAQGGLANLDCPAEDLGDAGTSEQTRFYTKLLGCLNAEWQPPVERAGFRYTEPGLLVFDSPVNTPCGNATPESGRRLAFYCPGDSVLYADVPQMRKFFGDIDIAYAILIGHEFGHHVQFETGVLDAYDEAVYDDYDQRLSLSRRVELQASCMGGLFLGAIADSFPVDADRLRILDQVAGSFGDAPDAPENRRDHGSGESNHDWILNAFRDNDIAVCNTFTAPESAVD